MKLKRAQLLITLSMIFAGLGTIAALGEQSPWRPLIFILTLSGLVLQGFWNYRGWAKGREKGDLVDAWKKGGLIGGLFFLCSLIRLDQFNHDPMTALFFVSIVLLAMLLGFFAGCVWSLSERERKGLK